MSSIVKDKPLKNWKVVCPKCQSIRIRQGDNTRCPNCNAGLKATYGWAQHWKDEEAKNSYRKVSCANNCGWWTNEYTCSQCEATIKGTFIMGEEGCFIATACYGDYNAKEVLVLRQFRDEKLLKTSFGKLFVQLYYFVSPSLAAIISKSNFLRKFIRKYFLQPIISKLQRQKRSQYK